MSVNVLGYQFDDNDEQVVEAFDTIIAHMNIDEDILRDYLFCCEKFDVVPSTVEELASCVLSPDLDCYVQTNFDYPHGYPAAGTAYEDIGHFLLDGTDLNEQLCNNKIWHNIWAYFEYEDFARDYIRNNGYQLGKHGYLATAPKGNIIISKDEIIALANYLSGHAYNLSEIVQIFPSINADILDRDEVVPILPTDYWIIEFNEKGQGVPSYKGCIVTPALVDSIRSLDLRVHHDQDARYQFYFGHIEKGKTTEHIRMDIGDNDYYNYQVFADLERNITQSFQAQKLPFDPFILNKVDPFILSKVVFASESPAERVERAYRSAKRTYSSLVDESQAAKAAANHQHQQVTPKAQSHKQKL